MMDATVTIVNFNTRAKLADCLRSIRETCEGMALEIIVVDNGSSDGSIEMVRQEFPEVTLVEAGENLGFGRAHNRAMAMGTGRHFIVLNPDTIVEPNTFRRLVRFMDDTADAGACGPTVKDATGAFAHSGHRDISVLSVFANAFNLRAILPRDEVLRRRFGRWLGKIHSAYHPHDSLRTVDWVDGACLVVRRGAWEQTGGFDEGIFLNAEDFDWCYRIRQKRWQIYHVPDVSLVHLMHQSKEQVYVPSYVAHYRSIIYLFRKHHGGAHSALVRAILFVAFSSRLFAARVSGLVGGRARRERDVEAFRAVIRTALTYDAGDASRGIARANG
jgi:GT2 family glycosyltransferase